MGGRKTSISRRYWPRSTQYCSASVVMTRPWRRRGRDEVKPYCVSVCACATLMCDVISFVLRTCNAHLRGGTRDRPCAFTRITVYARNRAAQSSDATRTITARSENTEDTQMWLRR